jgi:ABC-2 type transport system ATP-binding protein
MIEVENLTKRFGKTVAVDDLSFKVGQGEIVGFLGPNGAGKTTTMRMLSGFITPTGGSARINGLDVRKYSLDIRRSIGYMPENVPLYTDMRVLEYLGFRGRLKGLRGRVLRSRIDDVLTSCGLTGVRKKIIGQLSKGYRQRVGLADALLSEPELLILDEPTIGLDPNQIRLIRNLIKGLSKKHTVLLSSHILHEVEMICERVLIINNGTIVASDTPEKLVGLMKGNAHIIVEIKGDRHLVMSELRGIAGIENVSWEDADGWGRFTCECDGHTDVREQLFRKVSICGWVMREMTMEKKNLEDVFISMTSGNGDTQ